MRLKVVMRVEMGKVSKEKSGVFVYRCPALYYNSLIILSQLADGAAGRSWSMWDTAARGEEEAIRYAASSGPKVRFYNPLESNGRWRRNCVTSCSPTMVAIYLLIESAPDVVCEVEEVVDAASAPASSDS